MPDTVEALAQLILDATSVVSNAAEASPGIPVQVEVVSGLLHGLPLSSLTGTLSSTLGGTLSGLLTGTLASAPNPQAVSGTLSTVPDMGPGAFKVDLTGPLDVSLPMSGNVSEALAGTLIGAADSVLGSIELGVCIDVTVGRGLDQRAAQQGRGGDFLANPQIHGPLIACSADPGQILTVQDPLSVAFLLKPMVADDSAVVLPLHYEITISIAVSVSLLGQSTALSKQVTIPVDLPAVTVPALAVLHRHPGFVDEVGGAAIVMTPRTSSVPLADDTLDQVIETLNTVSRLLVTLEDLIGFLGFFVEALGTVADILHHVPVVYARKGNIADLGDFDIPDDNNFDDEASALLLLGVTGTSLIAYKQTEWTGNQATIVAEAPPDLPFSPLGVTRVDHLGAMNFDDGSTMNDAIESVRWGPAPGPITPLVPLRMEVTVDPPAVRAGDRVQVTVSARDLDTGLPVLGSVVIDGDPVPKATGVPFADDFHNPARGTVTAPGYPPTTFTVNVQLRAMVVQVVSPEVVPVYRSDDPNAQSTRVTLHLADADTLAPVVGGEVWLTVSAGRQQRLGRSDNAGDATFSFTFRKHPEQDNGRPVQVDPEGVVRAIDYREADVPFPFRDA